MAFADRTLAELLDAVAAQTPAPGGGSAAAWAGALAAALVEMAAAFALAPPDGAGERIATVRREAQALRARLIELAEEDLGSYEPVLEAMRLPAADPARADALAAALSRAADTPLAIAAATAQVAELAAEVAGAGSAQLAGDATTGALLGEASCRAASRLVELNLARRPDDPRLSRARELCELALAARAQALG